VIEVACGEWSTCALKRDGTVWCWGRNDTGQLGDGSFTDRLAPVQVQGLSDIVQIDAGERHTCALQGNGTFGDISCLGGNINGELGDGTRQARTEPVKILSMRRD
jgi:hypothetical protein